MIDEVALQAEPREETGKGPGRRLRAQGRIPAVVYGLNKPCVNVSVDMRQLEHLIAEFGEHAMIALTVGDEGEVQHIITRQSQRDPITDRLVHVDFIRIDPNKPIHIEIPVRSVGTAQGVKEGGILEELIREVEIRCLPARMPAFFEVDVSSITIGHSIHVSEVTPPEGVEILTHGETAIYAVVAPRVVEEVEAVAEGEEEAEPEVVGEEEKKEEEAEGGKKE